MIVKRAYPDCNRLNSNTISFWDTTTTSAFFFFGSNSSPEQDSGPSAPESSRLWRQSRCFHAVLWPLALAGCFCRHWPSKVTMSRWHVLLCWRGQSGDKILSQLAAWSTIGAFMPTDTHTRKTHQIFADFDRILEHSPNHSLVASGGGQGAKVTVIAGTIHPDQEIIQWNSRFHWDIVAWGQKHELWRDVADTFYSNVPQEEWNTSLPLFVMLAR